MMALRWVLLAIAAIAFANDTEKDMSSVEWIGGETVMDPRTGEKHFNGLATRCQIVDQYAFVTIPKLKPDVRATCCRLDMTKKVGEETKHLLEPFPPGNPSNPHTCEGLQSSVDLTVDHFGYLWVLDVGLIQPGKPNPDGSQSEPHICPPKVVAFDTATGKVLHQVNLLPYISSGSRLQFIIVDFDEKGNPFVYITDAGMKAIIVWNVKYDKVTRVPLPDKIINEYTPRDVLYAILIRNANGHNKILFTYRSADSMWCIETHNLQHELSMGKAYEIGKKPNKMILLGTDDWDCMYFRYEDKADVYKWTSQSEFDQKNFQLVHKSISNLTPTHTIADYKNGVMRICESNLIEYLKPDCPASKAVNSLTVMAVSESPAPLGG